MEAQIDWYEAYADLACERIKLQVFAMRSMASGAAFHCAYLHATQQAFLEAHELAFAYFGGVFRKLRYDNLTSAVKKVLRGSRREETGRFVVFRSHWRFEAGFVRQPSPTRRAASKEKPDIFGATTGCRCPKQRISPIGTGSCWRIANRTNTAVAGREQTVGAGMVIEREHLLPSGQRRRGLGANQLPDSERSGLCEGVDQHLLGAVASGRASASQGLRQQDRAMACGPMRGSTRTLLPTTITDTRSGAHLDVLYRKPGALAGSKPLEAEASSGRSMAAELRPDLGSTDGASGKTEKGPGR